MAENRWNQMGEVVAKAWADPAYKARLLSDATSVLKAEGIDYGPGVEVRILENTDSVRYITLPRAPSESELSEEQLERVAGGGKTVSGNSCHIPDS
jgi:hypothetical protein